MISREMGAVPAEYGDPSAAPEGEGPEGLRLYSSLTVKSTTGVILLLNLLRKWEPERC